MMASLLLNTRPAFGDSVQMSVVGLLTFRRGRYKSPSQILDHSTVCSFNERSSHCPPNFEHRLLTSIQGRGRTTSSFNLGGAAIVGTAHRFRAWKRIPSFHHWLSGDLRSSIDEGARSTLNDERDAGCCSAERHPQFEGQDSSKPQAEDTPSSRLLVRYACQATATMS